MAQLVAHSLWERGVASSSLAAPTIFLSNFLASPSIYSMLSSCNTGLTIKKGEMSVNKFLCILVLIGSHIVSSANCSDTSKIDPQLKSSIDVWVNSYVKSANGLLLCSKKDLQLMLNILYVSYERSYITIKAQENAVSSLDVAWHVFQNILQTRRNPSKEVPYYTDREAFMNSMNTLFDMQEMHLHIGSTYAHALDLVMNGALLTDKNLLEGIKKLREQSRRAIVHSLTDVNEYVDALLHTRSNNIDEQVKSMVNYVDEYSEGIKKNLLIADYLWSLVPYLGVNSFVKADDLTVTMSEQWWKTLMQMVSISNFIWRSVETARATLYLEYYKALYAIALNNDCSDYLTVMFDEKGVIANTTERQLLPEPQKLPGSLSTGYSVAPA